MENLKLHTSREVEAVFKGYPDPIRKKLLHLRKLILATASETHGINEIEECLKWGEPSYLVKKGSTIRIHWKTRKPGQYAMYFKCTSKLIPSFKEVYKNRFQFEGNRALVFQVDDQLPQSELKDCIRAGLTYHKVKNLPVLGLKQCNT